MLSRISRTGLARTQFTRAFAANKDDQTIIEKVRKRFHELHTIKSAQETIGRATEKVAKAFQSDGKVGRQFEEDGKVGGKVDEATSPNSKLDEDGSVGKQFTSEGKVGGKIDEKASELASKGQQMKQDAKP